MAARPPTCGSPHRPLQSALHLLHAGRGAGWLPADDVLTFDELTRLLRLAVTRLGITSVRFTGGEPPLYRRLEDVVAAAASLQPAGDRAHHQRRGLGPPGPTAGGGRPGPGERLLDTVDPGHFAAITRRNRLDEVLDGLAAAAAAGLGPVKVNAVLDPVSGRDDAVELLRFCLKHCYQLRIIEQMPLDADHQWSRRPSAPTTSSRRCADVSTSPRPAPRGSAPAQLWRVDGGPATVGIIASVSDAFCSACDRTRLTADGQVRSCLFAAVETDLRSLMRGAPTTTNSRRPGGRPCGPRPPATASTAPLRAADPPDERNRRLTMTDLTAPGTDVTALIPVTVRFFAAARDAAGTETSVYCGCEKAPPSTMRSVN